MTVGLLLQPTISVVWGGVNLSAYPNKEDGTLECLAQNVTVKLQKAEGAPTCSFELTPNPIGFEVFTTLKTSKLLEPWTVTFSYPGSDNVATWAFKFAGMDLTTGHDPKLRITGVSTIKGCWTNNKISYHMEAPVKLLEFPTFLQEKVGDCAKELSFVWAGSAKEELAAVETKGSQNQRTPHVILTDVMRESGVDVQVGDTSIDGTIVLSYAPTKEKELAADPPEEASGEPKPAVRSFHIVGVGLMDNVKRSQKFNTGSSSTKRAASTTAPVSPTVDSTDVAEPDSAPQESATTAETTTATLGESNPSSSATSMTEPDPKAAEKKAALSKLMTTTISFSVPMLPRNIIVKPRDICIIPSLKGPGEFLEDWEITSVQYKMDDVGGVMLSISGERPFTGQESMITGTPVEAEIKSVCAGLTTPAAWQAYYWVQGVQPELPLSS